MQLENSKWNKHEQTYDTPYFVCLYFSEFTALSKSEIIFNLEFEDAEMNQIKWQKIKSRRVRLLEYVFLFLLICLAAFYQIVLH